MLAFKNPQRSLEITSDDSNIFRNCFFLEKIYRSISLVYLWALDERDSSFPASNAAGLQHL